MRLSAGMALGSLGRPSSSAVLRPSSAPPLQVGDQPRGRLRKRDFVPNFGKD